MANETPEDLDKCFEVVSALVQQAGDVSLHNHDSIKLNDDRFNCLFFSFQLIASRFQSDKKVQQKSCETDLVTETDQEVEKLFINSLSEAFPHHR